MLIGLDAFAARESARARPSSHRRRLDPVEHLERHRVAGRHRGHAVLRQRGNEHDENREEDARVDQDEQRVAEQRGAVVGEDEEDGAP